MENLLGKVPASKSMDQIQDLTMSVEKELSLLHNQPIQLESQKEEVDRSKLFIKYQALGNMIFKEDKWEIQSV